MAYQQNGNYQYPQGNFQPLNSTSPPQSHPYLPPSGAPPAPKPEQQNGAYGYGDTTPHDGDAGTHRSPMQWLKDEGWNMVKKNPGLVVLGLFILAAVIALAIERDRIANAIVPHRAAIKAVPAIWLAPIGILILLSFPPLFGHEIVLLLVGLIWGYGEGFGIAVAGTLIGELLTFLGFKYLFRKRAAKLSERNNFYAAFALLMRDANLYLLTVVRYSLIPGHVITAVQSTTGVPVWKYAVACILSLPKQLIFVVLGVQFGSANGTGATKSQQHREKIIAYSCTAVWIVASIVALRIVRIKLTALYPTVKAQKAAAAAQGNTEYYYPSEPTTVNNGMNVPRVPAPAYGGPQNHGQMV